MQPCLSGLLTNTLDGDFVNLQAGRPMKFFIGGRYLSHNGFSVRVIEDLRGDDVYWSDKFGPGRCSRVTFKKWAASMSPDSPPAPLIVAPATRITHEAISNVQKEFEAMLKLRDLVPTFRVEPAESAAGLRLMTLNMSLNMLGTAMQELSAKKPGARLIQIITRVDTDAELVQRAISSLIETLDAPALAPLGEPGRQLMESLADGTVRIGRLRSYLGSCLGR